MNITCKYIFLLKEIRFKWNYSNLYNMSDFRMIHAGKETLSEYLSRIVMSRYFVIPIIVKDIRVKYSQTALGALWTVFSPFISIMLYVIFFGWVFKVPIEGSSYILFVLSGYACWNILSLSCVQVGSALQQNQELIKKMSVPKIIFPISKSLTVWIESSVLLVIAVAASLISLDVQWERFVFFPLILACMFLFGTSLGVLISSLTIYKRDILHGFPMLLQLLIWFTPVFYPVQILPDFLKPIIALNPFTGFIELFRWTLGITTHLTTASIIGVSITAVVCVFALLHFKSREDEIADYF